ncbi:protein kinase 7, putative [Plasmodium vinckei brucechwatti]|uniref:mitogen-activated protein kinase kinase n=1 Tax=Plasmodium vinckei brucechwatti TaxID=119398 RepID=A0A6V7RWT2_PLAVN|nr:protein kinase 7, putative [Plasmodium vinckei brucechwatti]
MREILGNYENIIHLNKYKKGGDIFINDYKIVKTIHEGKYSKILMCDKDGELYALKKYERIFLEKKREFQKNTKDNKVIIKTKYDDLKNELKIITDIKNEYCLSCIEIITNNDEVYIVNKYMENESILKYDHWFFIFHPNESYFIPIPVIKCMINNILKSLLYVHTKKNICHRDIKPSNILLDKNGIIKLNDFGDSEYMVNKKIKGTRGTYKFMPPEFFVNTKCYYGEKVDIWSLGICIYALFYKVLPFSNKSGLINLFQEIAKEEIKYHTDRNYFLSKVRKEATKTSSHNSLSNEDINFLKLFLKKKPTERCTAEEALEHKWLRDMNQRDIEEYAKNVYKKKHILHNFE